MAPLSHLITKPYPLRGQERGVAPHSHLITTPYPYVGRSVMRHRCHLYLPHHTPHRRQMCDVTPHPHLISTPYPLRGLERDVAPLSLIITTP